MQYFKYIAINLLVLAGLIGLSEIGVRIYENYFPVEWRNDQLFMVEKHPTRVWQYKVQYRGTYRSKEFETQIRTNSMRFRGPEMTFDPNAYRILFIGDSFTFGWGVEDNEAYPAVLKKMIEKSMPDLNVQVYNYGHWGYAFDQEYMTIKDKISVIKPHMIVQGFYWSGMQTLHAHKWTRDDSGDIIAVDRPSVRITSDGALLFKSEAVERPPLNSRFFAMVARVVLNWNLSGIGNDLPLADPNDQIYTHVWGMNEEVIDRTVKFTRQENIAYIPFSIPRDIQLNEQERGILYLPALEGKDLDLPTRRLNSMFEKAGQPFIDLVPAFKNNYEPDLYFKWDPHWTIKGHAFVAAQLLPPVLQAISEDQNSQRVTK